MMNQGLGMNVRAAMAYVYAIQKNGSYFDNVGISIDFIDNDWVYGITVGGNLEDEFNTIEDLVIGLREFEKNRLD